MSGVKIADTPAAVVAKKMVASFREQRVRWSDARMRGVASPTTMLNQVAEHLGLLTVEQSENWPSYHLVRSPKTGLATLVINGHRWWFDLSTGICAVGANSAEALHIYAAEAPVTVRVPI
jgi:hypothetical protein